MILAFGAQSHGLHTRCLRFAAFLPPKKLYGHARLACGWWPASTARDWIPAGSRCEVSATLVYTTSSSPRLCLAQAQLEASLGNMDR
jgi:hypothetical protein